MKIVSTLVFLVVSSCGLFAAVDRMPQVLKPTEIDYPADQSGPALVEVLLNISADGKVSSAEIRSSTNHELDAVCREAVIKWKFKPAVIDGKPTAVKALLPVVFADSDTKTNDWGKWRSAN
jgi:TonB family protein